MGNKILWRISLLILSATFAVIATAWPALAQQPAPSPIPPPAQPAPESPNAPSAPVPSSARPSGASPSSHMMRTWRRLTYSCEGDTKVVVNVHAKVANVVFKGHTYNMKQVDASEGQKYSDGAVTWTEKDEVGTLKRPSKSGDDAKTLASGCQLQTAGTNPPNPSQKAPPAQNR
jgi:membrane-bound inhibitor of C-type lysozyme